MIEVIIGSMYSGKTGEFLRRIERAEYAKQKVLVFKPKIDNRYSQDHVVSHNGLKHEAIVTSIPNVILNHSLNEDIKPDIVAIDEAQFFTIDLYDKLDTLSRNGIKVIVNGLDNDFKGTPFPTMVPLLFNCDSLTKLTAICSCGDEAIYNQRVVNGLPVTSGNVIQVGGTESYEARCRNCFISPLSYQSDRI